MGMYTELVLKFEINDNVSEDVRNIFEFLFGDEEVVLPTLPEHEFFKAPRWQYIGRCSSFYHHPESVRSWFKADYSGNHVFVRADLKNYDKEIQKFLGWAKPYISPATGNCLGWIWYEEWDVPELIIWESNNG